MAFQDMLLLNRSLIEYTVKLMSGQTTNAMTSQQNWPEHMQFADALRYLSKNKCMWLFSATFFSK